MEKATTLIRVALVAATLAVLLVPTARAADPIERTKSLIAVLQSDAALFEKARACQQLGEIGLPEAVPALATALADTHLSAYARSGLEGIPDPSAGAALRDAARKLKGPLLVGVVSSLGVLRDTQAVELLGNLAADPASGCANEALLALGNISSPESILFLEQRLAGGSGAFRDQVAAACLLAADRQRTSGDLGQALRLYELLRTGNAPTPCRVGATRGAILARTTDRVPFLIEQLRSQDLAIRNAALLTIREIPDDKLATALNVEIIGAAPDLQRQLLLALADCHNGKSLSAIQNLSGSPDPEVRKTALTVLGRIGAGAAPALLAALQRDLEAEEKSIVLSGLRGFEGSEVDDLLLQALTSANSPGLRVDLIRILDSRGAVKAAPEILKQAGAPQKYITVAALSALKSLAGQEQLPALMVLAKACGDEEVRDAAENALAGLCGRAGESASEAVLSEFSKSTQTAERNLWIDVLARVGYPKALPAIEAAANDADPAVAANALVQLGRWPNPAPIETVLRAMEAGATPTLRNNALVSAINLAATAADEAKYPESNIVQWLQRANTVAQSLADKRRILGILGRLKTIESFRLVASYLDNPDLSTEAVSGLVQIAPALLKAPEAAELKPALEKAAATVANADLRAQALKLSRTIPAGAPAVSLFDGASLAGWEGDTNVWRVRDHLIVGGSLQGNPRNEFLATKRSYTNYFLRVEYKLVGTEGFINSGVQFRSVRVINPPNEMSGYQADIGAGHSGCLYDESRRNTFLARCTDDAIKRLEKDGDWNDYEVRCEGTHIQIWLNGEKTVDYTERKPGIPQNGLIGLQIHGGNKAEVSFRNLVIQEL